MPEAEGVIIAAAIAGLVAFYSLIVSKEQTVSGFRQEWIDELRKDIATLASRVSRIHGESIAARMDEKTLWGNVKEGLMEFNEVAARTRLRLNPHENRKKEELATKAVLGILEEFETTFASPEPQFQKLQPLVKALVTHTQIILKENWKRVRSGERIYQITKWTTLGLTVLAIIISLVYGIRNVHGY
jgi:hypothetical protein